MRRYRHGQLVHTRRKRGLDTSHGVRHLRQQPGRYKRTDFDFAQPGIKKRGDPAPLVRCGCGRLDRAAYSGSSPAFFTKLAYFTISSLKNFCAYSTVLMLITLPCLTMASFTVIV